MPVPTHHLSEHDPSTHSLLNEPAVLDTFSLDSAHMPKTPDHIPCTKYNGSFSSEVAELIVTHVVTIEMDPMGLTRNEDSHAGYQFFSQSYLRYP